MKTTLTPEQEALLTVWQQHTYAELELRSAPIVMATMTENPHILLVPSGTGGAGRKGVFEFYAEHFLPNIPPDLEVTTVFQSIGRDVLVDERCVRFTHSLRMDWMLPGVPSTGRKVEFMMAAIVGFHDGKVDSVHLYWDQATVLSQLRVLHHPAATAGIGSATALLALPRTKGIEQAWLAPQPVAALRDRLPVARIPR